MSDREITAFLAGVVGAVEANAYEHQMLWEENQRHGQPKAWEAINPGLLETVGTLAEMPVCISLFKARVDGHLILFWHATSQVVDHRLIDAWMERALPLSAMRDGDPRKGVNCTDAMNFHNVFPRSPAHPPATGSPTADGQRQPTEPPQQKI